MNRRAISAASLAAGVVAVIIMAIWGLNAATAPIDKSADTSSTPAPTDEASTCPDGSLPKLIKVVRRGEIAVSVYNAGQRAGRARTTMDLLENAGYRAGAIGNAPDGTKVVIAEVHAKKADETAAHLVALSFGPKTQVVIDDVEDLSGPGVNVYIGDKFRRLVKGAPKAARLPQPIANCG